MSIVNHRLVAAAAALFCTVALATPEASPAVAAAGASTDQIVHGSGHVVQFDASDDGSTVVVVVDDNGRKVRLITAEGVGRADGGVDSDDELDSAMISPNGRFVVFDSRTPGHVEGVNPEGLWHVVYRYDLHTDQLAAVSPDAQSPRGDAKDASVADDGSVAFLYDGSGEGLYQAYLHTDSESFLVSSSDTVIGLLHGASAVSVGVSSDGTHRVAYTTSDTPGDDGTIDINGIEDVVVWDQSSPQQPRYVSVRDGSAGGGAITAQGFNADASLLAFTSSADLVAGDGDEASDVYAAVDGEIVLISGSTGGRFSAARSAGSTVSYIGEGATVTNVDGSVDGEGSPARGFLYDHATGRDVRASITASGVPAAEPVVAADATGDASYSYWLDGSAALNRSSLGQPTTLAETRVSLHADESARSVTLTGELTAGPVLLRSDSESVQADQLETYPHTPGTATFSLLPTGSFARHEAHVDLYNVLGERVRILTIDLFPTRHVVLHLAVAASTPYAGALSATVTALDTSGSPLRDVPVHLETNTNGSFTPVTTVQRTDAAGATRFSVALSAPQSLQARSDGDEREDEYLSPGASTSAYVKVQTRIGAPTPRVSGAQLSVTANIAAANGAVVVLQRRLANGSWMTLTSATVSEQQAKLGATLPAGVSSLRLRTPNGSGWVGSVSPMFSAQPKMAFSPIAQTRSASSLTVSTTLTPVLPGKRVVLQRLSGATWLTIGTAYQDTKGSVRFYWRVPYGRHTLRLVATGTGSSGYATGISENITVLR